MARKNVPGSARKPLLDRGVNGMTPSFKKTTDKDFPATKSCENLTVFQKIEPLDEQAVEAEEFDLQLCLGALVSGDYYSHDSGKEDDDFTFKNKSLSQFESKINTIIKNVFNIRDCPSPPPPEINDDFLDDFFIFEDFNGNGVDLPCDPKFELEDIDEMPPPIDYDLDEINTSY